MRGHRLVARFLALIPLLGAAVLSASGVIATPRTGALFFALASYARLAAHALELDGKESAILALEHTPFLIFAFARSGSKEGITAFAEAASAIIAWATLIALEELLRTRRHGFAAVILFSISAAGLGVAIETVPLATAAAATTTLSLAGYVMLRRRGR